MEECIATPISIVEQQIFLTLMAQLVQLVLPLPNRTDFGNHWKTSKNSRTLLVEIAGKTWCCVVDTVNAKISGSRRMSLFTEWEKRQQLVAHHTNWLQVKLEQSAPSHLLVAWCLCWPGTSKGNQEARGRGSGKMWKGHGDVVATPATFPCIFCSVQELPEATQNQEEGALEKYGHVVPIFVLPCVLMQMWFESYTVGRMNLNFEI